MAARLRDRLWFFAEYNPTLEERDRTVTFRSGRCDTQSLNRKDDTHNLSANVSTQLANNVRARVSCSRATATARTCCLPSMVAAARRPTTTSVVRPRTGRGRATSITWSTTMGSWASAGGYCSSDIDSGVFQGTRYLFNSTTNIGMPGVPLEFQRVTNFSNVPTNNEVTRDQQTRANIQADTTFYVNAGGQHAFKAGVQFDRIGNDVLSGETGNFVRLNWDLDLEGARGRSKCYQVRSNGPVPQRGFITEGNINNTNVGLFIQDAWTIKNKLTVNVGIRTENESVPSARPRRHLGRRHQVGLRRQVRAARRVRLRLRGRRQDEDLRQLGGLLRHLQAEAARGSFGGDKWPSTYTLDTFDWENLDSASCPPACPGTPLKGPVDFRHPSNAPGEETVDPGLDPMKMQEAAFGIERELNARMAIAARRAQADRQGDRRRGLARCPGERNLQDREPQVRRCAVLPTIFELTRECHPVLPLKFPKAVRDYDALELTFDKRFADNWALRASYRPAVWELLGLTQSDENGRTSPNVGRLFDYPDVVRRAGHTDEGVLGRLGRIGRIQFKLQGLYSFNFGTTLGANEYISSGVPISREAAMIAPNNYPTQCTSGG